MIVNPSRRRSAPFLYLVPESTATEAQGLLSELRKRGAGEVEIADLLGVSPVEVQKVSQGKAVSSRLLGGLRALLHIYG